MVRADACCVCRFLAEQPYYFNLGKLYQAHPLNTLMHNKLTSLVLETLKIEDSLLFNKVRFHKLSCYNKAVCYPSFIIRRRKIQKCAGTSRRQNHA